jgi:hypothetical protein
MEAGVVKLLSDVNNYKIVDEMHVDLAVDCIHYAVIKLTTVHLQNDDWCIHYSSTIHVCVCFRNQFFDMNSMEMSIV